MLSGRTSTHLLEIAEDLRSVTERLGRLERELPKGRTRDAVEHTALTSETAFGALRTEAAVLARIGQ